MNRAEVIARILTRLDDADIVVAADGAVAREATRFKDRPRTFSMLGSMGQVASIALGLALTRSERVVALDGDGNLMMGLGGLAMVGAFKPLHYYHVVLDNQAYVTTGGQRCVSVQVDVARVAEAAGYTRVVTVQCSDSMALDEAVSQWLNHSGPSFLRCIVDPVDPDPAPRIPRSPEEMAARFRNALVGGRKKETDSLKV